MRQNGLELMHAHKCVRASTFGVEVARQTDFYALIDVTE